MICKGEKERNASPILLFVLLGLDVMTILNLLQLVHEVCNLVEM